MGRFLERILGKKSHERLRLKFEKGENAWYVMQGHRILYIGEKQKCEYYMKNFSID